MAAVDETICRLVSAGRFISRGKGRHITRVIDSYELILVVSVCNNKIIGDRGNSCNINNGYILCLFISERFYGGLYDF